jgi:processive 1,2-diacylglycerol beta-glucosyltransferase
MRPTAITDPREDRPILILTIANGAGHIRTAQGIAAAINATQASLPVIIADVADYMTPVARFTHVTAYLWLVKHAPAAWERIDRYQKQQTHTSPEWFYRSSCRRLFELARRVRPRALVATEVGCCEIAALIKRDLKLNVPLVAINDDFDADRAWVQPEVDLYCFASEQYGGELINHGAQPAQIANWGAPLADGFDFPRDREAERADVCRWLNLDPQKPLVLIAGGGEGLGRIEETTAALLQEHSALQLIVLAGRNEKLKTRCERLGSNGDGKRLRVLGWTGPEHMPKLMYAADLMVSKLGGMFNEAVAVALPIVALEPPPGSERVQYRLLKEWQIGCPVRTLDELVTTVKDLVAHPEKLSAMRVRARARQKLDAAKRIAAWLAATIYDRQLPAQIDQSRIATTSELAIGAPAS